ncbi:MAG TPA: SAM-dependent methyltransferase [Acidimicrobiia bacterium]|nr:SAM-dependent methyltransferase [Acidimicrobiia bacterium]HKN92366.1 SAM-dependent methyltransferase [Acidimicrobiia bacterium]
MTDGTGTGANLPDGVSMTALGVAWVRAGESERPDRLFDDPLAARFLAASGWEPRPLGELSGDETTTRAMLVLAQSVIVRTRFLDDVLADAWSGGCRQVVILGAGLDTRAFRLAWPAGSRCFELDLPAVLDFKERALAGSGSGPACERILVPADLLRDWTTPLLTAGFKPGEPTVWIAEGLLIYFTEAENDRLLSEIGAISSPGDRLAVTFSRPDAGLPASRPPDPPAAAPAADSPAPPAGHGLLRDPAAILALWRWDGPADPAAWLAGHAWKADVYDREERARAYGRPLEFAEDSSAATRTVLVAARYLGPSATT